MIDWFNLLANSAWVLSCTLLLAGLSYASWKASFQQVKLGILLNRWPYPVFFNSCGLLFCLGLVAVSSRWWEVLAWLVLALLFALRVGWWLWQAYRLN